ncbi:syndecan-3 [Nematolebias whitei]|uniref:syndecan-3 n=1 Tax=Nematolebias whitei TaxID=451745 RepID=UPI001899E6EE|nr:syndecan-3 [Nematolebias whitei]
MKLRVLLALAALLARGTTELMRSPYIDDEGSARDDFYDDEDLYSGSGSGVPDIGIRPTSVGVSFTTEETFLLSTTQATSPAPSAPPAAEPSPSPEDATITLLPTEADGESGAFFEKELEQRQRELEEEIKRQREMEEQRKRERERVRELEREQEREREEKQKKEQEREREKELKRRQELERLWAAQTTSAPRSPAVFPVVTTNPATSTAESTGLAAGSDDLSPTEEEEDVYLSPDSTMFYPEFDVETTTEEDTPTTAETTPEPTTAAPTTTAASRIKTRVPFRPRVTMTTGTRAVPTTRTTRPQAPSTTQEAANEVGPVGPSGDFEIPEDRRNGLGVVPMDPDLIGNTVDGGSSAAQLPQKNILERKEVLIAVIVGGVVGALFAAFLVMLLVYRMKKKDEGSYTLEEPKQATVTYQKPDKQEEFYA